MIVLSYNGKTIKISRSVAEKHLREPMLLTGNIYFKGIKISVMEFIRQAAPQVSTEMIEKYEDLLDE